MACNCNKSGTTDSDFLTLVPGGTAEDAYTALWLLLLCGLVDTYTTEPMKVYTPPRRPPRPIPPAPCPDCGK